MPGVQLKNLSKVFPGSVKAVDDLSLEISDGELLVLMGPSGCGKSTTLRMIAGLEEVSEGLVHIDGKDITKLHPGKRNIGMVFQNYALYPHKTIFKNLEFGLKIRKVPKTQRNELIQSISERLNIAELLNRYPDQLSGGQKQRVALGRALLREGDLILFDEPLSNLDAKLRQQLRIEIAELHREKSFTGIFVTHDQTEAMTLGDRIAVMNEGKIVQLGTPSEIYSRPADLFVASFTGSPAMNLFKGTIEEEMFKCPLFTLPLTNDLLQTATIGIRPEDIKPGTQGLTFTADVIQPELNGMDWIIHAGQANVRFSCRSDHSVQAGKNESFVIDKEKIHYFDKSGKRIET